MIVTVKVVNPVNFEYKNFRSLLKIRAVGIAIEDEAFEEPFKLSLSRKKIKDIIFKSARPEGVKITIPPPNSSKTPTE